MIVQRQPTFWAMNPAGRDATWGCIRLSPSAAQKLKPERTPLIKATVTSPV
jgi:hypothetical protein